MDNSDRIKTIRYIIIFSLIVLAFAFLSPLLGGSPSSIGLGFVLWGIAPLLTALVMRITTRDWSDAGLKLSFKKNVRWYVVSILACPVIMALTLLAGAMFSVSSVLGFSMTPYANMVLPGIGLFFFFAVFEEFGWRGYLVPKLAKLGLNDYISYMIIAVVWATWHLPFMRELTWTYAGAEDMITFIPRFYLGCFAASILYGELRIITGSVWPVVLLHCLTNSIQHPFAADYLKILPGYDFLFSFNGLFVIIFTGFFGITLNRWRTRKVNLSFKKQFIKDHM